MIHTMIHRGGGDNRMRPNMTMPVSAVGTAVLVASLAAGLGLTALTGSPAPLMVFALIGLYLMFSIKVADQWEKVAVLRLGRYRGLRGPGIFHIIPVVD